jgi:hypothetical protein
LIGRNKKCFGGFESSQSEACRECCSLFECLDLFHESLAKKRIIDNLSDYNRGYAAGKKSALKALNGFI